MFLDEKFVLELMYLMYIFLFYKIFPLREPQLFIDVHNEGLDP